MIVLENLAEFTAGIDRWIEETEDLADGAFRGMCVEAFKYIVHGSPEWTGNLAASWRLTIGRPASGYEPTLFKSLGWARLTAPGAGTPSPYSKKSPNPAALAYALQIAKDSVQLIRLGADVFITNNAPYAVEVEIDRRRSDGRRFLRLVNLPQEMVYAALDRYGRSGDMSAVRAHQLAKETL